MAGIREALATYHQAMAAFSEAAAEGEPTAKDYEYRDDDAVRFAEEAAYWIEAALAGMTPFEAERVDLSVATRLENMRLDAEAARRE